MCALVYTRINDTVSLVLIKFCPGLTYVHRSLIFLCSSTFNFFLSLMNLNFIHLLGLAPITSYTPDTVPSFYDTVSLVLLNFALV
jgi:hypothetical protein